ncbi:MAG: lactonase family protein, partial [Demequinaceae bacterium]|nr:lactonase family protein [Demequinaceae bacterium]
MTTLWVGTYPAEGLGAPVGQGEGVWRLSLKSGRLDDAVQVTTQAAPSFGAR